MKRLFILGLLLLVPQLAIAENRSPLVGTWRLVSFEREFQAGGDREYPMGKSPSGYIHFLPEGRMAVVITGEGRKAPATDQDRADLLNTLVAYAGTYRVERDKWITTVQVSANPAWVGTEQQRTFVVAGDRLQEMTGWLPRPDGRTARGMLTYERMKYEQSAAGPGGIKAMLIRHEWKADWAMGNDKGVSDLGFEEVAGDKVVVKMRSLHRTCEHDVTITSDTVKFDGCFDLGITLAFDPNDKEYPFKGRGGKGYEYKVQPK